MTVFVVLLSVSAQIPVEFIDYTVTCPFQILSTFSLIDHRTHAAIQYEKFNFVQKATKNKAQIQ
jgi:hypothetical protein